MASDFSISQFRFLERLLVVHGHWCYKRIFQMVGLLSTPTLILLNEKVKNYIYYISFVHDEQMIVTKVRMAF